LWRAVPGQSDAATQHYMRCAAQLWFVARMAHFFPSTGFEHFLTATFIKQVKFWTGILTWQRAFGAISVGMDARLWSGATLILSQRNVQIVLIYPKFSAVQHEK